MRKSFATNEPAASCILQYRPDDSFYIYIAEEKWKIVKEVKLTVELVCQNAFQFSINIQHLDNVDINKPKHKINKSTYRLHSAIKEY
jgi:hypothetical protein